MKRTSEEETLSPPPSSKHQRVPIPNLGFVYLRTLGRCPDPPHRLICLRSDRVYTVGRSRRRRRCSIVFEDRCISRRHCQVFLDGFDTKLRLIYGFLLPSTSDLSEIRQILRSGNEGSGPRVSQNSVFVNGRRLPRGIVAELQVGDEIMFGCGNGSGHSCRAKYGFVVERIVFEEDFGTSVRNGSILSKRIMVSENSALRSMGVGNLAPRSVFLLSQLRGILSSSDPVSYLRSSLSLDRGKGGEALKGIMEKGLMATPLLGLEKCPKLGSRRTDNVIEVIDSQESDQNIGGNRACGNSFVNQMEKDQHSICQSHVEEETGIGCYSNGKTFFLNRLLSMGRRAPDQRNGVTLPELLHPVRSLVRVFIATFTCDVSWFLSCCRVPNHLPITIACHSSERCWSARRDSRTLAPFVNYPNLVLVYPPFPEVIAFGKDRKRQGIACHHPKLIVAQREDSVRVVVTSANLNSKQWNHITNTVWWQDFPCRASPDYSAFFGTIENSESDFAAQLAGFIASLITDVPSQAHWIKELTRYDFGGAVCHLVASLPGMHAHSSCYIGTDYSLSARQVLHSPSIAWDFLGSVQASVVGLSHHFRTTNDSNGAQVKTLASVLRKCRENEGGTVEVILKRNMNISADANAVSVLVADLDDFSQGESLQLGFLPRDVAKWVSPLSDIGFFNFSAFIYPKEALSAALGGSNMKVQLLLHVSKGPKFSEISRLIQPEHVAYLCSLLASIQRCLGIWRLKEVLSRYKWPESLETDFVYGSSSIGTSVNAQFLADFSAAAGKRSCQYPESEESDPEWGCWTAVHELRKPSMKILFPTIDRVRNGACGIYLSRCLLSLSEKAWQRLRTACVFHDAVPHPCNRIGYPMHIKVAQRRFLSRTGASSFGWIYCGSHNFSPAAWGRTIFPSSESKLPGAAGTSALDPRLHICNYELGIVFVVPPSDVSKRAGEQRFNLDDIVLPFVMPPPKYQDSDRPATARAMREALAEIDVVERDISSALLGTEEMGEDVPDEEDEVLEASDYIAEEKEEEKIYAEMLWSQVDSSENY